MNTSDQPLNEENTVPEQNSAVTIADRLKDLFNESPASAKDLFQNRKESLLENIKTTLKDHPAQKQQLGGPGIS